MRRAKFKKLVEGLDDLTRIQRQKLSASGSNLGATPSREYSKGIEECISLL